MPPITNDTGMVQYDPQVYLGFMIDDRSGYNHQYSPADHTAVSHQNLTGDHGSFADQAIPFNLPVTPFNNLLPSPSIQGDSSMAPAVLNVPSEQALGASSLAPFAEASTTHRCQFDHNVSACHTSIIADRLSVARHLRLYHNVKINSSRVTCLWEGCTKEIRADSLSRHIVNRHMKTRLGCPR
ncbi:hypothetical protein BV22DRAFT_608207 [Leucogyrophana mollusca]|uniref:Uncharacterized protein n=1 Tax=Leucogyrophana mollusca TaxID=85980 RepID=A0ACB8BBR9_9AGAM|nr:hypothetical protein BV22DRAFT_608207 [Leucogyrophana mollusca]